MTTSMESGLLIESSDQLKGCQFSGWDELLKLEDPQLMDHPHKLMETQMAGHFLKKKSLREHEEEIELLGKFEKSIPPRVFTKEIEDFFGYDPFLKQNLLYPPDREALDLYGCCCCCCCFNQLNESEGFDLDNYVEGSVQFLPIQPLTKFRKKSRRYKRYVRLTETAITLYNKQNDTSYKMVDVVKVNYGLLEYFITFTATDGSTTLDFQTRAEGTFCSNGGRFGKDYDVLFCRLKPKKMPKESASSHCSDTIPEQ